MKTSIMRALVRGIIHAENNMTMPEYIQDVREEAKENDERTAARNREQEQQSYQKSA
jgi:hypothetical protein